MRTALLWAQAGLENPQLCPLEADVTLGHKQPGHVWEEKDATGSSTRI